MKKLSLTFIAIGICLLLSSPVWSYTIDNGIDVGGLDTLYASTDLGNSGDQSEIDWVSSVLGWDNTEISLKYDVSGGDWSQTIEENDYYALELGAPTDYYLVKIGTGGTSSVSHYLFENFDSLQWAVIDENVFGSAANISIGRVSHVAEFNGGTNPVPEPASMVLLGIGLIAIAGISRKRAVSKG